MIASNSRGSKMMKQLQTLQKVKNLQAKIFYQTERKFVGPKTIKCYYECTCIYLEPIQD